MLPDPVEKTTQSGIIIPDDAKIEKPLVGSIVEVGDTSFKKGERILFSKYGYDEVEIEKVTYNIIHQDNVLGIFV